MASVYVANVIGDGLTPGTAYRPSGFDGQPCSVMMLDTTRGKCLVVSGNDTVVAAGVLSLVTAVSVAALRTLAATTNPTAARRTAIDAWLTNAGLPTLTVSQVSWKDCVEYVAKQVNSVASLTSTDTA